LHNRHQGLDFTVVLAAEDEVEELSQHGIYDGEGAGMAAT
jgi:hypothetical protein